MSPPFVILPFSRSVNLANPIMEIINLHIQCRFRLDGPGETLYSWNSYVSANVMLAGVYILVNNKFILDISL